MNATAAFWSRFRTNRPAVAGLAVLAADTGRVLMIQRALEPEEGDGESL